MKNSKITKHQITATSIESRAVNRFCDKEIFLFFLKFAKFL